MILTEIKNFISEKKVVSMMDLIAHFQTDPGTLREMLEVWINKGKIEKIEINENHCNKCPQCHMQSTEFYKWVDEEQK